MSDIHLTDGTAGATMSPDAFKKFCFYIKDMVRSAVPKELEIVLLGDIFDVIRSDLWSETKIRPWSSDDEIEPNNGLYNLHGCVTKIVKGICENNLQSFQHLYDLKKELSKEIPIKMTYVPGNHDWLINRYASSRVRIAEFMNMDDPEFYRDNKFQTEGLWEEYRVFARHGDIWDSFNYDGNNRDAPSFGDAVVIDLLSKFPLAVSDVLGNKVGPLIPHLKEIDNVRPYIDIPKWIVGLCEKTNTDSYVRDIKDVWDQLSKSFFDIDFVRRDKWSAGLVGGGLMLSKLFSFKVLSKFPVDKMLRVKELFVSPRDFIEKAYKEKQLEVDNADYIVYGHTHRHKIKPMDQIMSNGNIRQKIYFNTGTWRKVYVRASFDKSSNEFMSWHVMTFVMFYQKGERGTRSFEVWNGALG